MLIFSCMSRFSNLFFFILLSFSFFSCKKETAELWKTEIKSPSEKVIVEDISKEFYNENISLETFKTKYPWFQGTVSNEDFLKRKNDTAEIKIYKDAVAKINYNQLTNELSQLFTRVKHYYPNFKTPKVFLFSSALQMAQDPVFLQPVDNYFFIDISGFMGKGNPHYKGFDLYIQESMNPENIVPKVSEVITEKLVPYGDDHQKFIDLMVYYGKLMTLQDAFLPNTADHLKINYSAKQYEWAKAYEEHIWNFFVENNMVFSDDPQLARRFVEPGPFSKFYTQIDNESSPQIGIFIGWQICRAFYEKHPDTKLEDFMKMNATEIFNESGYKPTNQ